MSIMKKEILYNKKSRDELKAEYKMKHSLEKPAHSIGTCKSINLKN